MKHKYIIITHNNISTGDLLEECNSYVKWFIYMCINLPIKNISSFQSVVEQVCRLARTIASPQESAHTVLIAEGCPGRCTVIAKLAAHLCGYTVYQVNPCSLNSSREYKMEQFKSDLVQCYTRAGSKVGTCSAILKRSIGGHTKTWYSIMW